MATPKRKPEARERILLTRAENNKYKKWRKDIAQGPYRPFLETKSIHSIGRKHKFFCPKQQRIVHLISDGEWRAYNQLIWRSDVVEIQEQYALDITETFAISKELKCMHPYDYELNIHHIMSTDLIATFKKPNGALFKRAYPVKHHYDPDASSRTNKKLEIETIYWDKRKIPIVPVSACEISKQETMQMEFLSLHYNPNLPEALMCKFKDAFLSVYTFFSSFSLRDVLIKTAELLKLNRVEAEIYFKNVVLRQLISLKPNSQIAYHKPLFIAGGA